MGKLYRQSIKTTAITFTGALLGAVFIILSAKILLQQEFGISRNLINVGTVVQLFVLMGTSPLLQTYALRYPVSDPRRGGLIAFSLMVPAAGMFLFLLPYYALKSQIIGIYQPADQPLIARYYSWLPVLILLCSYMTLIDSYLIAHVKIALTSFAREVLLRLFNLGSLALYYFQIIDFDIFIILLAFSYGAPLVMMIYVAMKTEGFALKNPFQAFNRSEKNELIKFSFFHFLTGVSVNLIGYIDSLMLAPLDKGGMNALAVYNIAIFIVTLSAIPFRAMAASAFSAVNRAYSERDEEKLQDLFHRSSLNILIATVLMMVIIACNLDNALAILPKTYGALKPLVLILLLGRLIDMATGINNDLIGISKYYRFGLYISMVLLICIVGLNSIMIPRFGMYGAAWASTISLGIMNICRTVYLWKKMRLQPFSTGSLWILLAGILSAVGGLLLPYLFNPFIDAFVRTCVITIIFGGCILWWKPSKDVMTLVASIKERI